MRLIGLALTALALLLVPAGAQARSRDRDHDKLPDKWEKKFHISTHSKSGRRDPDRDGLNNRNEYRFKTNPRRADSDRDGVEDGQERAGRITSFDATSGRLVIDLANGASVSGLVSSGTEIECDDARAVASRDESSDPGDNDDDRGDDHGDRGENEPGDDHGDRSENEAGDDHGDGEDSHCGAEALTAGTLVKEAEARATAGGLVFEEIELLR